MWNGDGARLEYLHLYSIGYIYIYVDLIHLNGYINVKLNIYNVPFFILSYHVSNSKGIYFHHRI